MALAAECLSPIHLCRVRATRLNADGTPASGTNNSYVSDSPVTLTVTPVVEPGVDTVLKGGCDVILAEYRGPDLFKRFDLALTDAKFEPGLLEMMTGAAATLASTFPIGIQFPTFQFGSGVQPMVAFEAWQEGYFQDHRDVTWPYLHWVFPASLWHMDAMTLGPDFTPAALTGFTRGNPSWGTGIYGDQPEAAQANGMVFYASSIPTASCGYLTHAIS